MSITGPATSRGVPSLGATCIRNPGAAFTSQIAPLPCRETEMSSVRKSTPADVEADRLHGSHRHLDVVRVDDVGDVGRRAAGRQVAGRAQQTTSRPPGGTVPRVDPVGAGSGRPGASSSRRVSTFSCPMPRRGSWFAMLDQFLDRVRAVTHHVARHPLRHRDQLGRSRPACGGRIPGSNALDDHGAAVLARLLECRAHVRPRREVDRHAAAVVRVVGLDHHGKADFDRCRAPLPPRCRPVAGAAPADPRSLRIRLVSSLSEAISTAMWRRLAGDGRLDAPLAPAVAELDQAVLVEPQPGNVPRLGGAHQRRGAGAERAALGEADERVASPPELEVLRHGFGGRSLAGAGNASSASASLPRLDARPRPARTGRPRGTGRAIGRARLAERHRARRRRSGSRSRSARARGRARCPRPPSAGGRNRPGSPYEQPCSSSPGSARRGSTNAAPSFIVGHCFECLQVEREAG